MVITTLVRSYSILFASVIAFLCAILVALRINKIKREQKAREEANNQLINNRI